MCKLTDECKIYFETISFFLNELCKLNEFNKKHKQNNKYMKILKNDEKLRVVRFATFAIFMLK